MSNKDYDGNLPEMTLDEYFQKVNPDKPSLNPIYIKGLYIEGKYLNDSRLTITEKFLMSYIRLLDQEHHCYASNKFLAKLMGCSEKTISNMLVILKKKKCIEQVSWNGIIRVIKCL